MSEQILTQVEVDALLKGLSNGDIKTEAERREEESRDGIKPYDFSNQEKTIRGRMPVLDMINEKFCRNIRGSVFSLLRKAVDVTPEGSRTIKFEEFLRNLQVPSSLHLFQLSPLRGQGVLAIDPNLVFIVVDSYFGGDGRFHTRIEGRDFTNVEQAVIKKVVDVILKEIVDVWKAVYPLEFKYVRSEMNPHFVNIISPSDPVVICTFKMDIEALGNKFFFCLPFNSLDPIKDKLYGGQMAETGEIDKKWSENLRDTFGHVPLGISSEIGKASIRVSELLNLKAGDIIQLDKKAKEPLELRIEGVPKLLVRPGVMDNNYALKVMSAKK